MKQKRISFKEISLMLVTASATFLITFLICRFYYGVDSAVYEEVRRYSEARELIYDRYVGDYDESELTDFTLSALVAGLEDRWSYYLTAEQYDAYQKRVDNQYEGIGVSFDRVEETGRMQIVAVTEGGPAQEAGLSAGELILEIEGQPTDQLENDEIRQIILDHMDGSVLLLIEDERGKNRETEVACRAFYSPPVSWSMMEESIGYIRLANFDGTSGEEAVAAVDALIADGAESLIFDVRDNPGGKVKELLLLLDHLLPEGEIFIFSDRSGVEDIRVSDASCIELPMAVLVNENSYSAAEYFAAILQEYDWATVVGEQTTGKGRSQVTLSLSDGGAIHLSTSRYFTPGRVDLSEVNGITPDVTVALKSEADEQLKKALDILS